MIVQLVKLKNGLTMERQIIKITFVLALVLLSACYYDNEEELYGNEPCDTTNVTYSGTIEPIIQSSCATPGCHVTGGSANGYFESYANVKAKVDNGSFENRVVVQRDMPPGAQLNDCQILVIQQWLADGAPNN